MTGEKKNGGQGARSNGKEGNVIFRNVGNNPHTPINSKTGEILVGKNNKKSLLDRKAELEKHLAKLDEAEKRLANATTVEEKRAAFNYSKEVFSQGEKLKEYDRNFANGIKRQTDFRQNTSYNEIVNSGEIRLESSTPMEFHNNIKRAKESNSPEARWRVDIHDESDYDSDKLFVSDGGSCVAVEPNGNIISVCKNRNDKIVSGKDLLKKAIENGGDRLDAFGEDLYSFYTRNGFEPISYTNFNEDYAPEGWKKGRDNTEPIIFYRYTGKQTELSYEDFINNVLPSVDYDTAMSLRDKEIKNEKIMRS